MLTVSMPRRDKIKLIYELPIIHIIGHTIDMLIGLIMGSLMKDTITR